MYKTPAELVKDILACNLRMTDEDRAWAITEAVIAHVRPQIEAEARAAAIEEALNIAREQIERFAHKGDDTAYIALGKIRAFAAAPTGFEWVPVEPTKAIIDAMLEPLTAHCFLTTEQRIVAAYKDMIRAARK